MGDEWYKKPVLLKALGLIENACCPTVTEPQTSRPRSAAFSGKRGLLWKSSILKSIITCLFRIKLLKAQPPFEGWRLLIERDNNVVPYTFDVENHSRKIPGKTETWNCTMKLASKKHLYSCIFILIILLPEIVPCHMRRSECSLQISPVWKPHLPARSSENQEAAMN